jgi:hypothetical protein
MPTPAFAAGVAGGAAVDAAAGPAVAPPTLDADAAAAPGPPRAPQPPVDPSHTQPLDASVAPAPDAETTPTVGCAPGIYAAELWCQVDPSTVPPGSDPRFTMPMSTQVSFAVERSAAPQWLEIRGGTLEFEYLGSAFLGRLAGGLDCSTLEFHADIVDGSYASLFAANAMPGAFQGEIDGRLRSSSPTITGSWWHGPADVPRENAPSCVGTWTAQRQP